MRCAECTSRTITRAVSPSTVPNATRVPSGEKRGSTSSSGPEEKGSAPASWCVSAAALGSGSAVPCHASTPATTAAAATRAASARARTRNPAWGRCGSVARRANGRDEPVPDLRQGLDVAGVARVVPQHAAEVGDDAREHFVVHHPPRPGVGDQRFAGDDLARRRGQAQQHVHEPRLDAHDLARDQDLVGRRPDLDLAEPERRAVAQCGVRHGREEKGRWKSRLG